MRGNSCTSEYSEEMYFDYVGPKLDPKQDSGVHEMKKIRSQK